MATIFSCEHCGRLLSTEIGRGGLVVCRHCRRETEVPAALADLPAPQLAGQAPPEPPAEDLAPDQPPPADERAPMRKIAAAMPWVISALVHVTVGLLLMLVVCIVMDPADAGPPPKPSVAIDNTDKRPIYTPAKPVDPDRPVDDPSDRPMDPGLRPPGPVRPQPLSPHEPVIGPPALPPGSGDGGPKWDPIGRDDKTPFPQPPGGAANIVYVVDRSGSMHRTFGIVRAGMQDSIIDLYADEPGQPSDDDFIDQWFHVILFADGEPLEHEAQRLVPATAANKGSACAFLQEVQPSGQTDPVPALRRAFAALARAPDADEGTVLFLLTDGDFPDNREVLETITRLNGRKTVMINTILFGRRTAESERVMRRIADENGGRYKFVSLDEIQGDIR